MTATELDFDLVTESDIPELRKYLSLCHYEESNHNIVNMFIWMNLYPLYKVKTDKYYLLLGMHQGELFIYMPLCEEVYFDEAILKAKSIFDRYNLPFVLSCFTERMMDRVLNLFPQYSACPAPESFDYVYLTEKLITLSGKKLQKKRNHLNAFYTQYQDRYQYETVNTENAKECIDFLMNWKNDENEDEFMKYEREGIVRLLRQYDDHICRGGIIRIDGEIKAFAIGSILSDRMCQINVEKADDSVRGIYQAIMRETLRHEFSEFEYCNREDDMGKENLRQAKRAYAPEMMIEKFRLCPQEG